MLIDILRFKDSLPDFVCYLMFFIHFIYWPFFVSPHGLEIDHCHEMRLKMKIRTKNVGAASY